MIKILSTTQIYDLINKYPDVKDIMVKLGFKDITKPGMMQSVGKVMTIEKGAKIKRIEWEIIDEMFKEHGYLIIKEDEQWANL